MRKITPKVTNPELSGELWKGIIEELFDDFLHFFFPKFVHEVDFTKPSSCKDFYGFPFNSERIPDVSVEYLLKEGLNIEKIVAKVEVSEGFVKEIQKKINIKN